MPLRAPTPTSHLVALHLAVLGLRPHRPPARGASNQEHRSNSPVRRVLIPLQNLPPRQARHRRRCSFPRPSRWKANPAMFTAHLIRASTSTSAAILGEARSKIHIRERSFSSLKPWPIESGGAGKTSRVEINYSFLRKYFDLAHSLIE